MALKAMLARKAVKTTAKHTVHGTASKLRRDRMRTATLLALGALIGAAAVWLLGRLGGSNRAPAPDPGTGPAPGAGPAPGSGSATGPASGAVPAPGIAPVPAPGAAPGAAPGTVPNPGAGSV